MGHTKEEKIMSERLVFKEDPNGYQIKVIDRISGTSLGKLVRYAVRKDVVFNPRRHVIYSGDDLMEIVKKIKEINKEIKKAYQEDR